ncbi:MAG: polyprenyl synthetase family protein [Planctomycetaceae bacterium]|nr:polyprenyl synthetase family protein [Planctomycetaceae bacterium]
MHVFPQSVLELIPQVEAYLDQATQFDDQTPVRLKEAIRYSLLAGGKRLRPVLLLLCYRLGKTDSDDCLRAALPAAAALEMIHTYSLIHDDLPAMDDDDLRRGRPTCHIQFDEATAILAGDGLLTLAFETLATGLNEPALISACCRELAIASGVAGMVGGQQADLEAESCPESLRTLDQLRGIHRRKTGALIRSACRMGGILAKVTPEQLQSFTTYGEAIGLAFQIADDLLDETGTTENMGKRVAKDQNREKMTYPGLMGLENSRQLAKQLVESAIDALRIFPGQTAALEWLARYSIERDR